MDEDERKGDIAGHSLGPISLVARVAIVSQVRMPAASDPHSDNCVEENRQEDKGPLDDWQKRDAMDRKDRVLEYRRPAIEARVGHQVDAHIGPHRHQSTQGVESTDEKVVFFEESRQGPGLGRGRRGGSIHSG